MLKLKVFNYSFPKEEQKNILELKKLFEFFANLEDWSHLEGIINLILINDAEIHELNLNYRQKDKPTDVLSFPYFNFSEISNNEDKKLIIGEIFISRERSIFDACDLKISFQEELNKLLVHSVLHVLGFDHIKDNDFLIMKRHEDYLLNSFYNHKIIE